MIKVVRALLLLLLHLLFLHRQHLLKHLFDGCHCCASACAARVQILFCDFRA